jgi:hypothetical protein
LTRRAAPGDNPATRSEEADVAWKLAGQYFENCSCDVPCPCTVSLDLGSDLDRCRAFLVFQVENGEVDGVDVSGLTVAAVADTPKVMRDGNWRLGVLIDEAASDEVEVEVEVQEIVSFGKEDGKPARLSGIFHPAGDDLTVARATKSELSVFGIEFDFEGRSAFANPFSWAA